MKIPRTTQFDSTLGLRTQGYELIRNTCRELKSDVYEGRLLLQKTIFMMGEEAARLFYDNDKFQRSGAMPVRVQKTLIGIGSVQSLDGDAHRHRKHLFVQQLMSPEKIEVLQRIFHEELTATASTWPHTSCLTLFPELQLVLCRAVCRWAQVPLDDVEAKQKSYDFGALIESGGRVGPEHWKGRFARKRLEQWAAQLITAARSGSLTVAEDSPLYAVALHRDLDGELLPARIAAVELLNILRPTVAIARFMIFAALALHEHSEQEDAVGDEASLRIFVQEVRRFYPFFPQLAARVRSDFQWRGYHFPQGRRVILDLYGTNHDERSWEMPEMFNPQRFSHGERQPFGFIPQGGGDYASHHRCPGEYITIALMQTFLRFMTREISYNVPRQDLAISLKTIPTLPASGFVIEKVRLMS